MKSRLAKNDTLEPQFVKRDWQVCEPEFTSAICKKMSGSGIPREIPTRVPQSYLRLTGMAEEDTRLSLSHLIEDLIPHLEDEEVAEV